MITPRVHPVKVCVRMESIASRLAALRRDLGLSTRKFAELVTEAGYPIRHSTVGSYEREEGTEKIPADYLAAVCIAFRVNPTWLLLNVGPRVWEITDTDDPYRRGREDVAAAVVELLMPDLLDNDDVRPIEAGGWRSAVEAVRRRRGAQEEEDLG